MLTEPDHRDKYHPAVHDIYLALYAGHRDDPATWSPMQLTRVLTATLASRHHSWRVIGITEAALYKFAEMDFRYISRCGITRAHLVERKTTVHAMFDRPAPLTFLEFSNLIWERDRTVLTARGENKNGFVPQYIPIENEDGNLFSERGQLALWKHGKAEREFLRAMHARLVEGELNIRHPPTP